MDPGIELVVVTMVFDTGSPVELAPLLSKYVVASRRHAGCRNIDLATSATRDGRFVVIQKWTSPEAHKAHVESAEMAEMAAACRDLLERPPVVDVLDPISVQDLE